ncbi:MAG: hypothetical protein IPQ08_02355 [Chitinophagaceae bacterium]|nr:hypothetical protein [Chitinophagaceae bacterium]
MSKKLSKYDELEQRRLELDLLLKAKKELVIADLEMLQADLKGPAALLKTAGQFVTPQKTHPLLKAGISKSVDLLVNGLILGKAGWITRNLVSYLVRNYSTYLVEEKKATVFQKISSWFHAHSGNGKAAPVGLGDLG